MVFKISIFKILKTFNHQLSKNPTHPTHPP